MEVTTTQQAAMEAMIANFERVYPSIHVQAQYIVSSSLPPLLLTQFQAGNAPDLFRVSAGERLDGVWPLARAGRLLDLSGAKWNDRMYAPMKKYFKWQGKTYAWPDQVSAYGALYNVDLFKQLGLSIPTSFAQVLSQCQKINAAGKVPFAAGWRDVSTANIWVPQRAAQYVYNTNPNWNTDRGKGKTTFASSPAWQQALQSISTMKDSSCFQPGAQGSSRAQAYAMFGAGNAAMIVIAAAELPNIVATNPSFKYAMFNLPGDNPKTAVEYAPTSVGIGASATTQHPAQVKTFLAFITREQQSRLYAKVGGGIAPLDLKKALLPAYMAPVSSLIKAGRYDGSHHGGWPSSRVFDEALAPCVLGLITGQTTVASCLGAADAAWASGP